ncbi:hypothetical protein E4U21_003066 [Claviceps maximensis]|nr:hypothetical protein E4U21_003066 [Claviceps maximensis]
MLFDFPSHFEYTPPISSSPISSTSIEKEHVTDDVATPDVPPQLPYQQASNERSVFNLFCQLSSLSHESLYLMHNPSRQLTAQNLLHHYTKYLLWYDELPEALRLGHNSTPKPSHVPPLTSNIYVCLPSMYYHCAIVMLFWPVADYAIIGTELSPKHICTEAADAILALLQSYASLYTLRRTPSLTPYLALTAAVVHLAATTDFRYDRRPKSNQDIENRASASHGDASGCNGAALSALRADVAGLEAMTQSHHLSRKALGVLGVLFRKWGVGIDIQMEATEIALQDCMDICWPFNRTRLWAPPLGFSAEHLDREMEHQDGWPEGRIRTTDKTVESVQHPLFVPMLELQRRTRLTEGALGRAGFSHVS